MPPNSTSVKKQDRLDRALQRLIETSSPGQSYTVAQIAKICDVSVRTIKETETSALKHATELLRKADPQVFAQIVAGREMTEVIAGQRRTHRGHRNNRPDEKPLTPAERMAAYRERMKQDPAARAEFLAKKRALRARERAAKKLKPQNELSKDQTRLKRVEDIRKLCDEPQSYYNGALRGPELNSYLNGLSDARKVRKSA